MTGLPRIRFLNQEYKEDLEDEVWDYCGELEISVDRTVPDDVPPEARIDTKAPLEDDAEGSSGWDTDTDQEMFSDNDEEFLYEDVWEEENRDEENRQEENWDEENREEENWDEENWEEENWNEENREEENREEHNFEETNVELYRRG